MAGARILLVEDDPAIARSIIYTLERDGLSVTHSLLLGDARIQISRQAPDAVILDVGLPDGSGLDLCRELRAAGSLPRPSRKPMKWKTARPRPRGAPASPWCR